jgi:hypothetical protein
MKNRNLVAKMGQLFIACTLLLHTTVIAYPQTSRPRYSHTQTAQRTDEIPVDTVISLKMDTYLSSKTAHVGDKFTATVTTPVQVNGVEAIPAGATITGRVTQVAPAKRMNKSGMIALDFDEISLPNGLSTQIVGILTSDDPETQKQIDDENRMSGGKSKDAAVFVGGSGVLGAILGGITGGGKGAAVGGAVGAGVGLASVLLSKGEEAMVPAGTEFGLRLKQPLPVPNATNTYDPSADNSSSRASQGNPPDANPQDSSADVRGQAARGTDREVENSTRPRMQNPNSSSNDSTQASSSNTSSNRDAQQPTSTDTNDSVASDEELPLSSAEMIRRAQHALHEEGYYEGALDGVMTQRMETSLKAYQREHNLPQTGILDNETARSLRIVGASNLSRNQERVTSSPRQNSTSSGQQSVERPSQPSSSVDSPNLSATRGKENPLPAETRPVSNPPDSQVQTIANTSASILQRQAADVLAEYQKLIGVRLTGTGIELTGKAVYTDDEIGLLYALDSFANSTQLYTRLLPSLQAQQAIRGATLAMAREARKADKIFTSSSTRWVNTLNPRWDAIRQEVLKLMYAFNINTSELDY